MMELEVRACPVCGSSEFDPVFQQSFSQIAGMPAGSEFLQKLCCCKDCGLVHIREYLSDQEMQKYYSAMSNYEYSGSDNQWPEWERKKSERQFSFVSKFRERFGSVLDVGCSLGYTLSLFKQSGSEVLGIEPSPKLKDVAKSNYGVDVVTGFVGPGFDIGRQFDLVILSHVAEHLKSPVDILKWVSGALKEDGLLFVEVPSIEEFDERDLFQFSFEHINYFSHGSLANLMHRAGFEEVDHIVFENDDGTAPFYPTLGSLWRKASHPYPLVNRYAHDRKVVGRYAALVERYTTDLKRRIADIMGRYGRLAIWGAGTLTAQLLAQTPLARGQVVVIYDNDPKKNGLTMSNIPIRKPGLTPDLLDIDGIDAVIVGSWSNQQEIFDQLVGAGLPAGQLVTLFKV